MHLAHLRTPLWRTELRRSAFLAVRPVLAPVGRAYRSTLARKVRVVAVVGTYGKSTTTRAVAAALGCEPRLRHPAHEVVKLRPKDRHAAMEVGIHAPGQMAGHARLVRPDVVVVTSIGSEHRDRLKSVEGTRWEKAEMVRFLGPSGIAVLNGDDPNVVWMATQSVARLRTFGLGPTNDVRASDVAIDWPRGTRFTLHADGETRQVLVRLLGRHMLYPALAAVAVALEEGVSLDGALAKLETLAPAPNRVEIVPLPSGAYLVRDHCKTSLETVDTALEVLGEIPAPRKVVVLGDLERPPATTAEQRVELYSRLGARVAQVADRAVFVNVDIGRPRPLYTAAALAAGMPAEAVSETPSIIQAVDAVKADLRPGDVVLVEGAHQQHFDRIALALAGRTVGCDLEYCTAWMECGDCPMLKTGWDARSRHALSSISSNARLRRQLLELVWPPARRKANSDRPRR